MSFKIGFVQRHGVAFQVTGAMRWHGFNGSLTIMRNVNTDVEGFVFLVRFCFLQRQSEHACSLIPSC